MVEVTDSSSVSTTEKSSQKCEDFFHLSQTTKANPYKKANPGAVAGATKDK